MREIASGLVVFVLLCASAGLGILIRSRLPEHHRTRDWDPYVFKRLGTPYACCGSLQAR